MAIEKALVRPAEAAEMMSIARSTLYLMIRQGVLPVVHVGRAARIPTEAIRTWIARECELTSDRGRHRW